MAGRSSDINTEDTQSDSIPQMHQPRSVRSPLSDDLPSSSSSDNPSSPELSLDEATATQHLAIIDTFIRKVKGHSMQDQLSENESLIEHDSEGNLIAPSVSYQTYEEFLIQRMKAVQLSRSSGSSSSDSSESDKEDDHVTSDTISSFTSESCLGDDSLSTDSSDSFDAYERFETSASCRSSNLSESSEEDKYLTSTSSSNSSVSYEEACEEAESEGSFSTDSLNQFERNESTKLTSGVGSSNSCENRDEDKSAISVTSNTSESCSKNLSATSFSSDSLNECEYESCEENEFALEPRNTETVRPIDSMSQMIMVHDSEVEPEVDLMYAEE